MKQIYYELDCSALMCYFEVRINDVCVFSLNVDGQATMDIPINSAILEKGEHEIEVRVFPMHGEKELHKEAYVRYKVIEYDVSSGDFKFIQQFENFQTPPVEKGIPFIIHKSVFMANVSYKIDAWQNGLNIKDLEFNVKENLVVEYKKIINDLSSENYNSFINTYKKKEKNTATAMYLSPEEANNRIVNLINDFKTGFKVMPITDDVYVQYSAYNKLASLKRINKMSALYLENPKTEEEIILDINFYIPKGKTKFEVI